MIISPFFILYGYRRSGGVDCIAVAPATSEGGPSATLLEFAMIVANQYNDDYLAVRLLRGGGVFEEDNGTAGAEDDEPLLPLQ